MALWNGSSFNTNEASMMLNQIFNKTAIPMVRHHNGLLYAILGKQEINTETGMPTWQRNSKITGHQIQVRLRGADYTMNMIADGAAEYAVVTPQDVDNMYGAAVFDLGHYSNTIAIKHSALHRFAGQEAATVSYLGELSTALMETYEADLGNQINGVVAPGRTAIGGWQYAIDDGATYDVYGTISRADAGNADYRAATVVNGGALTPAKIKTAQLACRQNNGRADVGVCASAVYSKINTFIEGFTHIVNDSTWNEFGSDFFSYGGTKFVFDHRLASGVLGLLDSSSWVFYTKDIGFTNKIMENPSWKAADALRQESWAQLICLQPNKNAKLINLDA